MAISEAVKRLVVLELGSHSGGRLPRGHRSNVGDRGDVMRPLPGLFIGLERKRADLMLAVAVLAFGLEDRRDVLGICRR